MIILSSITALTGNTVIGAYGVSTAAEAALARNLAVEWGPKNIRVNAIAPGLVRTDFAKALLDDPERLRQAEQRTPLRRIGKPDDIAGIAVMLAEQCLPSEGLSSHPRNIVCRPIGCLLTSGAA